MSLTILPGYTLESDESFISWFTDDCLTNILVKKEVANIQQIHPSINQETDKQTILNQFHWTKRR